MMEAPLLLTFVFTSLIIELTPGPNMAYLAILAHTHGRRAGFSAVAGVATGLLLVGLAAAVGLATLVSQSPLFYGGLRWGGVIYLLWLAREGWQMDQETSPGKAGSDDHARYYYRGLITNLLNPKAALFYIAVLPGFLSPSSPAVSQGAILTVIYVSIATAIHILIVILANASRVFFASRNPLYVRRALSLLLALVAIWFGWKSRQ